MKPTKKLSHKHLRYLTKKEFKDPLYAIAEFCRSTSSLSDYQADIADITHASDQYLRQLEPLKISNLLFSWRQIVKHIELLYLLSHKKIDWVVHPDEAHHKLTINLQAHWIHDSTLRGGTYLNFERLKLAEMRNISIFINKFFKFKSLRKWYRTMDEILETFFEEYSLSDLIDYAEDRSRIFNYLEKLADAIFIIYATKARAHIFKYYVRELNLEVHLGKEQRETDGTPLDEAPLPTESPAMDKTGDDG